VWWLVDSFRAMRGRATGVPWSSTKIHLDVAKGELPFVLAWFRERARGDEGMKRLIAAYTPEASPAGFFDMFPDGGKSDTWYALQRAGRKVAHRFPDSYRMEDTDKAIFDLQFAVTVRSLCEKMRGAL
jgi:hypothetical protein